MVREGPPHPHVFPSHKWPQTLSTSQFRWEEFGFTSHSSLFSPTLTLPPPSPPPPNRPPTSILRVLNFDDCAMRSAAGYRRPSWCLLPARPAAPGVAGGVVRGELRGESTDQKLRLGGRELFREPPKCL